MEQINVDRLVGEILRLDREVEALSTAGRLSIGQQVRLIECLYKDMIEPQISGSQEAHEMGRMLRAMEVFCGLDEADWKRLLKARKQAIDVMRATTETVVRRLVRSVLERGNM